MTALHYAAESEVVDYLVKQRTIIDIKAHDGIRESWQTLHEKMELTYKIQQIHDNFRVHGRIISWSYTGV